MTTTITPPGPPAAEVMVEQQLTHHAWDAPERLVIEGVPEIGFHVRTCPFPGSLEACLRVLGLRAQLGHRAGYDYLMAVTGAAFRRFWQRDDGGNVDLMYLAPEPHRRAFHALGLAYRVVPHWDRDAMVAAVKESIARGVPALGFGIVGPPECGIVTGYDRGGGVLVGRSYLGMPAGGGYYEKAGWFESLSHGWYGGLILLGEPTSQPPEHEVLRSTLSWAIELARLARRPSRPEHLSGLIAYEGWARGLEVDADYPADDPAVLATREMVHADQVTMLCERRSAARYLRGMIDLVPGTAQDSLFAAAAEYDRVADRERDVWPWGHEMGPAVQRALARPETRRAISHQVMLAAAHEVRAVEYLEHVRAAILHG